MVKKHLNENKLISNIEILQASEVRQISVIPKLYLNIQKYDNVLAISIMKLDDWANIFVSATRSRRDIKIPLCLSAPVRNNHGLTQNFDFSVLDRKYTFRTGLVQKS